MNHLADDYELGTRIADLELAVKLSDVVVETYPSRLPVAIFFAHQLRWARGVRDVRAAGYFGLIFRLESYGRCWQ